MMTRFKHIVTAICACVALVGPLSAQDADIDSLYQQLLDAEPRDHARLERQVITAWERSGSPALDLLLRRGKDALEDGDPQAAVEHFTALVDHAPGFSEGYYGRASAYYLLGLTGPALDDIRQVLILNDRHFEAMRGFATIMEEIGKPAEALEIYQMVADINPQSPLIQDAIARLELQLEGLSL